MPRAPGPGPIVLDGGLATELEARGHDLSDRLWSARLLVTEPQAIEDVHLAYYRAGAQVAITASYQATIPGFAAAGLDRAAALAAIRRSVQLAQAARDRADAESVERDGVRLVAGSVGPYATVLADGSEYRGDYDPGPAVLREVHGPRIDALLEAGADVLALETIPTMREAEVLVRLVEERHAPAWLSYQCRDGTSTAAGEPIADAIAVADAAPDLVAVGVNCTAPRHVPALLAAAGAVTSRPLIAYPNGGDTWDPVARRWLDDESGDGFDAAAVAAWTELGARWLGGCCRTGPAEIAALAHALAGRPG
ncbi:MAG TPA: homocysteine S-methyltransferase [Candidatus Limnocylindrales bacterium]